MTKCIMNGCDLHDKTMLLKISVDLEPPVTRTWDTDQRGRAAMIRYLQRHAKKNGADRIVFAYEACGFGFGLYDELTAAGIETYVLAPSKMARSPKHRQRKTDERDAQMILELLRGYILAGNELPSVWVPDAATRQDRELVRRRLTVAEDSSAAQTRIRWLLKGHDLKASPARPWTQAYWEWLEQLRRNVLPLSASGALGSLMRQVRWLEEEGDWLMEQVTALSRTPRYVAQVTALCRLKGVGVLTAMVFLTEMGDLNRFHNRRQVGAYLGLVPASYESGEDNDHKGHITRQGPSRVRKVLCQATWSRLRSEPSEQLAYDRIVTKNPKHKKIATVARMRVLAIRMWHAALSVPQAEVA